MSSHLSCTRESIHVLATAQRSHASPTCNRQPIDRQLSAPAYVQAQAPTLARVASHPNFDQCCGVQELSDQHVSTARRRASAERRVRAGTRRPPHSYLLQDDVGPVFLEVLQLQREAVDSAEHEGDLLLWIVTRIAVTRQEQ